MSAAAGTGVTFNRFLSSVTFYTSAVRFLAQKLAEPMSHKRHFLHFYN